MCEVNPHFLHLRVCFVTVDDDELWSINGVVACIDWRGVKIRNGVGLGFGQWRLMSEITSRPSACAFSHRVSLASESKESILYSCAQSTMRLRMASDMITVEMFNLVYT